MKQLEVQIMGQSYLLGCPDGGEEQLLKAVHRVDAGMCKIRARMDIGFRARRRVRAGLAVYPLIVDMVCV